MTYSKSIQRRLAIQREWQNSMTNLPGAIRILERIAAAWDVRLRMEDAIAIVDYIRELERKCEGPKTNGDHFDGTHG